MSNSTENQIPEAFKLAYAIATAPTTAQAILQSGFVKNQKQWANIPGFVGTTSCYNIQQADWMRKAIERSGEGAAVEDAYTQFEEAKKEGLDYTEEAAETLEIRERMFDFAQEMASLSRTPLKKAFEARCDVEYLRRDAEGKAYPGRLQMGLSQNTPAKDVLSAAKTAIRRNRDFQTELERNGNTVPTCTKEAFDSLHYEFGSAAILVAASDPIKAVEEIQDVVDNKKLSPLTRGCATALSARVKAENHSALANYGDPEYSSPEQIVGMYADSVGLLKQAGDNKVAQNWLTNVIPGQIGTIQKIYGEKLDVSPITEALEAPAPEAPKGNEVAGM